MLIDSKFTTLIAILLVYVAGVAFNSVHADETIELVIIRSEHTLVVKQHGNTLRTFKVAFGSGGRKAKLQQGDHTTPKGDYQISKIRNSNRFHIFMQLDYPNVEDAERALNDHIISRKQYQSIVDAHRKGILPPQNTALGGAIGIHGIGLETKDRIDIHQVADWTQGCIAMRNHEIEELDRYIDAGTHVSIID